MSKMVVQIEQFMRMEKKSFVTQQKNRIGENCNIRDGTKNKEIWLDGWEMKKIKDRMEEIKAEKDELEKLKKSLKLRKSDRNGLTMPS